MKKLILETNGGMKTIFWQAEGSEQSAWWSYARTNDHELMYKWFSGIELRNMLITHRLTKSTILRRLNVICGIVMSFYQYKRPNVLNQT